MQVAIDKLSDTLQGCPHFDRLRFLCKEKDAYIVGGAIRDALNGRPITDLDLIFPEDPTAIARDFARQVGGHWFWLDQERRQSRVVINDDNDGPNFDFALFRAPTLHLDLLDRDFTINAIALPLAVELSVASLVDPCNGLADLQQSSLVMVDKNSFANDPLRILKGVRHATVLGLEIEKATLMAMRGEIAGLGRVAPERVRQEIWKIIADEEAAQGLQLLQKSGAGEELFGAGFAGSLQQLTEELKGCRGLWRKLLQGNAEISAWLIEEIEQGLSVETLLLLTFMMASIDRALPNLLAEKWRLSRKARASISAVVALDKVKMNEFNTIARTERAFVWWSAPDHIDPRLLLLALAVVGPPDSRPSLAEIQAWVPLVAALDDQRPLDLVDGHWLRSELGLKDGPEMTKVLHLLRNAEIFGKVSSQDDARQFLLQIYQNKD